ncbi:MAG: hypothetical protein KGQ59_11105 [Bdellovibrionales bacterium]|nr:hypothetical protein [Bdellovibrionales bacterium]
MKNRKKKFIAVTLATSIFATSSTLAPRRSEAAIGLLVATAGSNPAASVFFFLGAVGTGASAVVFFKKGWRSSGAEAFVSYLLAAGCAVGAYLLLDGPHGKAGELPSLSASDAQRLGLTESEWKSYESDLALANALREESMRRTASEFGKSEIQSEPELQKYAESLRMNWKALTDGAVAPETLSAIQKMSQVLVNQ